MKQYRIYTLTPGMSEGEKELNSLALEGWEVIQVLGRQNEHDFGQLNVRLLLERTLMEVRLEGKDLMRSREIPKVPKSERMSSHEGYDPKERPRPSTRTTSVTTHGCSSNKRK